ncbi:GNAT family N-acetyltransferase [Micromonospora avicenniae]|uniref:GNAT family N-acetyltransferase n=1 Tax=Micromonospora avicenniae TaxID=1198245 RepID=UPI003318A95F
MPVRKADLLGGQRVDAEMVAAAVTSPNGTVLVTEDGTGIVACCQLERHDDHTCFGMFAVAPPRQRDRPGRQSLAEAERFAREQWHVGEMRMTVITQRADLIAWYERRGYTRTGELTSFPYGDKRFGVPRRPDPAFETLTRKLG